MNNKPLTKTDLNKALDTNLAKQDVKWDKRLKTTIDTALAKQDQKWDKKLKTTIDTALAKQDVKWDKKLEALKKEIIRETANFFQTSIIPTLDRIENKLDETNNIVDNHERRLEKAEDKLFDHEQKIKTLQNLAPLTA